MILIPEIEAVVILVPRTGSGSLYRAVLDRYPKALMPYRHMEADGVYMRYYHPEFAPRNTRYQQWPDQAHSPFPPTPLAY